MPTRPLRSAALATVLTVLSTMLLLGVTSSAPAAAGWTSDTTIHDAKLQVCRTTVKGTAYLRLRLDNRAGKHAHRGGVYRRTGGATSREVRAAAGRISAVKKIKITKNARFDTYVGEIGGAAAGGVIGSYGRC
ncbi:hypothetical protein [Nocardioides dongkuii]|uniref:hypothetical protein n=1 Tax=Nocardioides dongkuii TaxID=2760089 RepID=UPI0015FAB235|nr:hypothetical protein [Nocardioides dongkuii]